MLTMDRDAALAKADSLADRLTEAQSEIRALQEKVDRIAREPISPDALTGMEANLRFPGPETMETKIFGRLSAWQNWIFQRPNAVGERGALKAFGGARGRPEFDWKRT